MRRAKAGAKEKLLVAAERPAVERHNGASLDARRHSMMDDLKAAHGTGHWTARRRPGAASGALPAPRAFEAHRKSTLRSPRRAKKRKRRWKAASFEGLGEGLCRCMTPAAATQPGRPPGLTGDQWAGVSGQASRTMQLQDQWKAQRVPPKADNDRLSGGEFQAAALPAVFFSTQQHTPLPWRRSSRRAQDHCRRGQTPDRSN